MVNERPESNFRTVPFLEYTTQEPADPIELRIYGGADGQFVLYKDEKVNYDNQQGIYATIPIRWNEARQELTLGKRQGRFPGMLEDREFRIAWVGEGHGSGVEPTPKAYLTLHYRGKAIKVKQTSEYSYRSKGKPMGVACGPVA